MSVLANKLFRAGGFIAENPSVGALKAITAGAVLVDLVVLTNANVTRIVCGVDAGGFAFTNQAQSTTWMTLDGTNGLALLGLAFKAPKISAFDITGVLVTNNTATTVCTLPATAGAIYRVYFTIIGAASTEFASADAIAGGNGTTFSVFNVTVNGSFSAIGVTPAGQIQITQTSGISKLVNASYIRIM
jgi:hypothetical protein